MNLDRFGLEGALFGTPTDEERVTLIEEIIAAGYEDKILLGHDSVNVQLGRPNIMTDFMKDAMKHAHIGDLGENVIPEMRRRGFDENKIEILFVKNPERFFE